MKKRICACLALVAMVSFALSAMSSSSVYRTGAEAKVTFRIVDDEDQPVSNAVAHVWFSSDDFHQNDADWDEVSDVDGLLTVSHKTNCKLVCRINKDGYYESKETIVFPKRKDGVLNVVDGKWQPYGETRTVVLKKIKNPIKIGEFGRCSIKIPVYDEWVGFDFERRMWVPPYGDGKFSDVLLKFGRTLVNRQTDYKMTMDVSFTNNPFAGCYKLTKDEFSERKTVYNAMPKSDFCSALSYIQERHPDSPRNDNRIGKDSYLVFRTRTRIDEDGKLISAHYGIISGQWSFFDTMLSGGYLFNPTPNDTNLEDAETYRLSLLRKKQNKEFERRRIEKGK